MKLMAERGASLAQREREYGSKGSSSTFNSIGKTSGVNGRAGSITREAEPEFTGGYEIFRVDVAGGVPLVSSIVGERAASTPYSFG
jgi:hypothetical protein